MPYLALTVVLIALDQAVKSMIQSHMVLNQTVPVIDGVFHLTYIRNTGAAFSILEGQQLFFILVTMFVSAGLLGYVLKNRKTASRFLLFSLTAIAGGGIGNMIDRIRLGYVVDFLDLRIWPIFNVADIGVTVGSILLVIYFFVIEPKNKKETGLERKHENG